MSDVLKVAREGAVVTLTIDDPAARNALSPVLTQALVGAWV
jgi:enoyl-CoA hydratase/carnithine racemase